ncbi:hypothetical protein IGI37_000116 [Enterococcus sp. AZ194]|uniref:hypothetical protein n=1 Tax=Enterococcus sp. AZ194 TaxID=2774629 RepID=UPI003F273F77
MTTINLIAKDLQGIIKIIAYENLKNHEDGVIPAIKTEEIEKRLPWILQGKVNSPLLDLELNESDNLMWSTQNVNLRYYYDLKLNEHLLKELVDALNQIITSENDNPAYEDKNDPYYFSFEEDDDRIFSKNFLENLETTLRKFDLNHNEQEIAEYTVSDSQK